MKNIMIPMIDYVLEKQDKASKGRTTLGLGGYFLEIVAYAQFLKQTPALWMFIPVDKEGNVLEEPLRETDSKAKDFVSGEEYYLKLKEYQKALSRVYFKGFEIENDNNGHEGSYWVSQKGRKNRVLYYNNNPKKTYTSMFYKTLEDLTPLNLELTGNHLK